MLEQLYKDLGYGDILHDVNGLPIPFDPKWTKIGVAVSGGADSALLLHLLCDIITKNSLEVDVHVISNIRGWKAKPWQRQNSIDVYNYIRSKFSNIRFHRHENFVPPEFEWADQGPTLTDEYGKRVSGDIIELRAFAEFVGYTEQLDAYYNAVTRNPKSASFNNAMPTRDVDPSLETARLMIMPHMDLIACHPLRFVDKSWVASLYKNLDLFDLFNLTRSCEGDKTVRPEVFFDLDYKTYKPGDPVPICGRCFWCRERAWAWHNAE